MQKRVSDALRKVGQDVFGRSFSRPDLPEEYLQATTLAESLGDFSILPGNHLTLLSDYDGSIDRLIDDIDKTEKHCHLLYYIFHADPTGEKVAEALIRASQRGVKCRLLLDSVGAKSGIKHFGPRLRAAGIEVRELLKVRFFHFGGARIDLRNHRKLAILDGIVAYIGSQNIVDKNFRPGIVNQELVARVSGPVVLQLQAVFLADRFLETGEELDNSGLFPETQHTGESPAQVLPSGPGYPHDNNQRVIVSLLHAAEKRIVLTTPYFVPDVPLLHALTSAAIRGIEVHLIVSEKIDQWLVGWAQRSYYEEILDSGVKIHLYQPGLLHAKNLSIDDTVVVIGSSNLDLRSFLLNSEVNLIVYDTKVAQDLREIQERHMTASRLLMEEEWDKRPLHKKMLQNTARLVDALL